MEIKNQRTYKLCRRLGIGIDNSKRMSHLIPSEIDRFIAVTLNELPMDYFMYKTEHFGHMFNQKLLKNIKYIIPEASNENRNLVKKMKKEKPMFFKLNLPIPTMKDALAGWSPPDAQYIRDANNNGIPMTTLARETGFPLSVIKKIIKLPDKTNIYLSCCKKCGERVEPEIGILYNNKNESKWEVYHVECAYQMDPLYWFRWPNN